MSWIQTLVACGDANRRSALLDILSQAGMEPESATSVNEVRAILGRRPMHIIFCEDDLPEGGYREVLRVARGTGFRTQVVVASPLGELDQYLTAMQLGAFDFVAPPYRPADIVSIINSVSREFLPRVGQDKPSTTSTPSAVRNKAMAGGG
jgi:DNA-binding NtrC family response regulator